MSELLPVLETLVADVEADRPVALCVVLRTKGSTPQSAGAAMLVRADMTTIGTLGGGCVENDVRRRAFSFLDGRDGAALDFLLDQKDSYENGLVCGGRMTIGVQPVNRDNLSPYRDALALARNRRPAILPISIMEESVPREYRVRLEVPPTLFIAGAGHVGQAVARLAMTLDFRVVVIDDRADYACEARLGAGVECVVDEIAAALRRTELDEACYVVIVTRGHQHDHAAVEAVIGRPARYIGLIGSRRKSRLILEDLEKAGATPEQVAAIHTPIGLDIGAVTVPEIAISIVAELIQHRRLDHASIVEGPLSAD
ncbi:MAG TPA: XdhC family protein [Phycisphaerae bacterium]|nr:XdhC family protein [Phycisphaerae bacterium]HRW56069.1 XdhC family protein [Phycisphaerae bacterium]